MAAPPRFRRFNLEDYPGAPSWLAPLFLVLNETIGGLVGALANGLTRSENLASVEKTGIKFHSPASGSALVTIGNQLGSNPKHCWITSLVLQNGAAPAAAFSLSWSMSSRNELNLTLLGLAASTDYLLSVVYE